MVLSKKQILKTMKGLNKAPLDDKESKSDLKKIDQMPRTSFLVKELIDPEKVLKNHKKIKNLVTDFIKANSIKLSTLGPTYNILFSKEENKKLFKLFDIDKEKIVDTIKECPMIDTKWNFLSDPMNIYLSALTGWLLANEQLCKDSYKYLVRYIVLRDYTMVQKLFFKHEANPQIMDYTIENSLSNRFKLKKFNTILEFLIDIADNKIDKKSIFHDRIKSCEDRYVIYFIQNIHSTLTSIIYNIANKYYTNYENNKQYKEEGSFKSNLEGEGYIDIPNSLSNDILLLSKKILNKFFSESHIDKAILELSCQRVLKYKDSKGKVKIDKRDLRNMINRIGGIIELIKEKDEVFVKEIVISIIAYFLNIKGNSVKDVKSAKFYQEMNKTYSVSNTNNPYVIKIKDLLQKMMETYSKEFQKTKHKSTTIKMRSCVYYFFVIFIMKYSD